MSGELVVCVPKKHIFVVPEEYRNEYVSEYIHSVLESLGYDTSELDLTQCLDLSVHGDYRCYWNNIVIVLSKDYSKLTIIVR